MSFKVIALRSMPLILAVLSLGCRASAEKEEDFNLTEVAAGLYVHNGLHVSLEHPQHDDIANIGFIVGERCVAVIDTGGSYRIGKKLRTAIGQHTSVPICYVINTHIHYDHLLGNVAFQQDNPKFIGHKNLAGAILRNREFFLKEYGADLGPAAADSIIGPDITVDGTMEIDLGNRKLILTAHPVAHTHNDLTVYDPKTKTLWLSDLLFKERIPVLDGSLRGWLALMAQLKTSSATYVVPGHGPVSDNWPEAASAQERYLQGLLTEIRQMIAEGRFMEDVIESAGLTEQNRWLLFEQDHRRNVSRAFIELEWE